MAAAIMMFYGRNTKNFDLPTKGQISTIIDVDEILESVPAYIREHQQLREQYIKNNNTAITSENRANNGCSHKLMYIPSICKFILMCGIVLLMAMAIPINILLGRGNGFDTRYHKYKDLPAATCLGGANITDIWYSPPYPYNTTATYAPAWATYKTWAFECLGPNVDGTLYSR